MTMTELSELLLVRLYDLANEKNSSDLHDLNKLAEGFGESDRHKVEQAAHVLDNRGLISVSFNMVTTNARITGEGSLFVEQGGQTNVIPRYRENPSSFTVVDNSTHFHGTVSGSNVAVGATNVSQSIDNSQTATLLNEIHETLVNDQSLDDTAKADLLIDVETLRAELARSEPRPGVLKAISTTLGNVVSIAAAVAKLVVLFG